MREERIIDRILAFREHGESQRKFAARLGVDTSQLNRYMHHKFNPSIKILERIARNLGASMAYLTTGYGNKYREESLKVLGAKTTRKVTDHDRAQVACTWIDEMDTLNREEKDLVKALLLKLPSTKQRKEVLRHLLALELASKMGA